MRLRHFRRPRQITRRSLLLGASAAAILAATPASAWLRSHAQTPPADVHWMYVFTGYANEAAAKVDLSEFVAGSAWISEATAGITVSGESGYSVAVRTPLPRDDLFNDKTNCRIEIQLRAKVANRTKIPYLTLIETTISVR